MGVETFALKLVDHGIDWVYRIRQRDRLSALCYGTVVGIRGYDGTFWMCDTENGSPIASVFRRIREWERFEVVDPKTPFSVVPDRRVRYGDQIAFRAAANENFVGADLNTDGRLWARVAHLEEWETFVVIRPPKSREPKDSVVRLGADVAFTASNGKTVRFALDQDRHVYADVPHVREHEVFRFIRPRDP